MKTGIAMSAAGALLVACIFPACAEPLTRERLAKETVPAVKKDCTLCHTAPDAAALRKPAQELCLECHADRAAPNDHKTGVTPAAAVKNLPLRNGKVTCITCHDPHRGTYQKMLRAKPKDLCIACHNK